MALSVTEADQMIAAATQAKVVLRVYENFVFYPPHVRAKQMIEAGEIGEPQMIRMHVSTGKSETAWKVPLSAWVWRFDEGKSGGGPLVFDHGNHLFSLAHHLMGDVARVYAWIDRSRVIPTKYVDAPATIMFQFKSPRRYGVLDFAHTPNLVMDSIYYADDDRVEVIGDKGVIFINRCTARTVDLPPLMLFKDGRDDHGAGRALRVARQLHRLHAASDRCAHEGRPTQAGRAHRQGRARVQPRRAQIGA